MQKKCTSSGKKEQDEEDLTDYLDLRRDDKIAFLATPVFLQIAHGVLLAAERNGSLETGDGLAVDTDDLGMDVVGSLSFWFYPLVYIYTKSLRSPQRRVCNDKHLKRAEERHTGGTSLGISTAFVMDRMPFSMGHSRSTLETCSHRSALVLTRRIRPYLTTRLT